MRLKTRFYIVVFIVVSGFISIASLTTLFFYKINELKKADAICFETIDILKHLQVLNAELLYSVELDKTWENWILYRKKLHNIIETLHNAPYIHKLLVTPQQKGLLKSLYLFWASTGEKLDEVENSMGMMFLEKNFSRDGLIQQYHSLKNSKFIEISGHIMDGSLYLKSDFEVKLSKLVSIIEEETKRQYFNTAVMIFFISFAISIIVSTILISFLTKLERYLGQLHYSMRKIGRGNYSEKLQVDGNDELSQISLAINATTDNLGDIHKELEERIVEAESASTAKSLFLANMSHELRTPLNSILGFTKLISRDKNINDEQKKNLSIINRSGGHLLALINDILTISKIEAGGLLLNEQKIDLHLLLNDLKEMFSVKARQRDIEFILSRNDNLPRYIVADEIKLRQVLINLIQNGLKFTPEGHVQLSVYRKQPDSADETGQMLQFEVHDTGIGIDKKNHNHIFEVFAQIDPSHEKQQGVGLGLPLSRQYVELMKGTLTVTSAKDKGATFAFAIPVTFFNPAGTDKENKTSPNPEVLKTIENSLPQDLFSEVPEDLLANLKISAERAEMDKIFSAIQLIEPFNDSLAETFTHLANEFAYDRILALIANRKGK